MKIRNGFVSNSSSSSFIVTIIGQNEKFKDDKALFAQKITECLELDSFQEFYYDWINKEIEWYENCDWLEDKKVKEDFIDEYIEMREEPYIEIEAVSNYLWHEESTMVSVDEKNETIELDSFISMFNSERDIPNILKDLVIGYQLENRRILIRRERDY